MINGNSIFADKTAKANEIENSEAGCTLADLKKIIALREEANMIFSTRDLQLLLSNDYHRLARVYKQQEMWPQAYDNYLQSVSKRIKYLCLSESINDNFYKSIYEIALLYQCIGDIPAIEMESRSEAYYLSACLFEIASKWNYESAEERFGFYSSYFAGMINHKILLFALEDRNAQAGTYAVDAFAYYEKSLSFDDYRKQRSFQYLYLSQVCELSQRCLNYGYFSKGMCKWAEYGELAQKYKEMSR